MIPAVETTEPLSTDVASPTAVESGEASPAADKPAMKSEKRKSSMPFAFGKKKEAAASSDEEGEKKQSTPLFSKLRQTVKGNKNKNAEKAADKPAGVEEKEETPAEAADKAAEPAAESAEAAKPAEEAPAAEESADKPAVPAATPVSAAA